MAHCIFVHRADSPYDDFPEERYQFPKRYLNRAMKCERDWIAYYEPRGGGGRLGYSAIAKVEQIVPDEQEEGMYVAQIEANSFALLDEFVSFRTKTGFVESDLQKEDGSLNQGLIQWAIRPISARDFSKILDLGFPVAETVLPREETFERPVFELADEAVGFVHERQAVSQVVARIPRDRVFRRHVLEAYESTCSLTGLKLLNGGGRAEVQAAHIRPVNANGPDTVRNGIALSGTVHWMFDRGLISLDDDLNILVSRQANDQGRIWSMMNSSRKAKAPANLTHRPHPKYLAWHRQNCFKY